MRIATLLAFALTSQAACNYESTLVPRLAEQRGAELITALRAGDTTKLRQIAAPGVVKDERLGAIVAETQRILPPDSVAEVNLVAAELVHPDERKFTWLARERGRIAKIEITMKGNGSDLVITYFSVQEFAPSTVTSGRVGPAIGLGAA
jgi:hypothetical protein